MFSCPTDKNLSARTIARANRKRNLSGAGEGANHLPRPVTPADAEIFCRKSKLVQLVKKWAEREQATPAQIALAWLMAQKPWIVPIPGTTQMPHLLENIGADSIKFTPEEITELNRSLSVLKIQGARLPEAVLQFSGVEAPVKS